MLVWPNYFRLMLDKLDTVDKVLPQKLQRNYEICLSCLHHFGGLI